jgi:hypothetical protein
LCNSSDKKPTTAEFTAIIAAKITKISVQIENEKRQFKYFNIAPATTRLTQKSCSDQQRIKDRGE